MYRFLYVFLSCICATLLGFASPAQAHAFLKHAAPAPGAVLSVAPNSVMITFTEEVEPAFSSIAVANQKGERFDIGKAQTVPRDAAVLTIQLKTLQPGTYQVTWHATATDTHRTKGSYRFTLIAAKSLAIRDSWARPTPPGMTMGVVYFAIDNATGVNDELRGADSPVAAGVEMHVSEKHNNVDEMRPLTSVPLKSGSTTYFRPFGMHLMLTGLKAPLVAGHSFPLTLHFAKSLPITVQVGVSQVPPAHQDAAPSSDKGSGPATGSMPGMNM